MSLVTNTEWFLISAFPIVRQIPLRKCCSCMLARLEITARQRKGSFLDFRTKKTVTKQKHAFKCNSKLQLHEIQLNTNLSLYVSLYVRYHSKP